MLYNASVNLQLPKKNPLYMSERVHWRLSK